jgi:UDP-4-amino-4,6-dideoxy-N-acetyl-beta-L-altrosamine N-acetyltransferase
MLAKPDYCLCDVSSNEIDLIYEWRNADHVRPFMMHSEFIELADHYKWYERCRNDQNKILKLCLYRDKPIGLVQFSIDEKNKICEWGFYIGEKNSPRGSGRIMGLLALDFIFQEVGLRKVCAHVLDYNEKSLSYHKKLGFHEEGRLLKQIFKKNEYVDVVLFGLLKENWELSRGNFAIEGFEKG